VLKSKESSEFIQVDVRFFFVEGLNSSKSSKSNDSSSSNEGRWRLNDISMLQNDRFPTIKARSQN
jgi:hypothetical protein